MTTTVQEYLDYVAAPWGRIFYDLLWHQLDRHLPEHRVRILDVGCGFARTSIRLAGRGHAVTAIDPAPELLDVARRESSGVAFLTAGIDDLGQPGLDGAFDWVLCHNVLEYVPDAEQAVRRLAGRIAPGGHLSLVMHNPVSHVVGTIVQEKDPEAAAHKLHATTASVRTLNRAVNLYPLQTVLHWLQAEGLRIDAWYGVRCLFDYVSDNDRKRDLEWYRKMLTLEQQVAGVSPYRDIAKFIHIVAAR